MTTCFLAPDPIQSTQFIPGGNTPANGGQLFFYAAGSSTKQTVYKDNAAAVAWSNPIVLDSGGNLPLGGEVWFPTGQSFKVVFAPANDGDPPTSPYWTKDTLAGINDISAQIGSEWVTGPTPTFIGATSFTVAGDQTAIFTLGRRLKTTNTGGTVYSTIVGSAFGVLTTVTVVNDSGVLDAGLSAVFYGLFDPANVSISAYEINRKGATVASAGNGTTNIWGTVGDFVHVSGTNTIFNFSSSAYAGAEKTLIFDGALTLANGAALSVPGAANISTAANDRALVRADTVSTSIIALYNRAASPPYTVNDFQYSNLIGFPGRFLYPAGYIQGLVPSTTDANSIQVSTGVTVNSSGTQNLILTAPISKSLTSSWTGSTGGGGLLDAGSISTNIWYHGHLVKSTTSGWVDTGWSSSFSAPVLPAGYTVKSNVPVAQAFVVAGSTNGFFADELTGGGLLYQWASPPVDFTGISTVTTAVSATLSTPSSIRCYAIMNVVLAVGGAGVSSAVYLSDLNTVDLVVNTTGATAPLPTLYSNAGRVAGQAKIMTNTSSQIRTRLGAATGNASTHIATLGWEWARR